MNILVTAGNTLALIDKVRCITNIFTGRTGASIALEAHAEGHHVILLTSHPEAVHEVGSRPIPSDERWKVRYYRTFEDLDTELAALIKAGGLDVVIHCAAVSDYLSAGIYAPSETTQFDVSGSQWKGDPPTLVDRSAGKVKSDAPELWLRLVKAPKLVDRFRSEWGFRGLLVKFKLEVGLTEEQLLETAERSRQQSHADLMVANTLEESAFCAYVGPVEGKYHKVTRRELPAKLMQILDEIEQHGS